MIKAHISNSNGTSHLIVNNESIYQSTGPFYMTMSDASYQLRERGYELVEDWTITLNGASTIIRTT